MSVFNSDCELNVKIAIKKAMVGIILVVIGVVTGIVIYPC